MLLKQEKRKRRHKSIINKLKGTSKTPRLCVFRSNQHIYAQLIDDEKGKNILSSDDFKIDKIKKEKCLLTGKKALAWHVGKKIAEGSVKKGIKNIIFDRSGYKYHGRVKALADGARQGGLKF